MAKHCEEHRRPLAQCIRPYSACAVCGCGGLCDPGVRCAMARRPNVHEILHAEAERERDAAVARAHRIEAAAAATAETLDALIYWHDCGDIDRSWWEDAREKLATLRAAMADQPRRQEGGA